MTTIINSPPTPAPVQSDGGSGLAGILIVVVIVAVIGFLFFVYGLPAMRGSQDTNTGGTSSGPTINVPDKVQVDINK